MKKINVLASLSLSSKNYFLKNSDLDCLFNIIKWFFFWFPNEKNKLEDLAVWNLPENKFARLGS